MGEHGVRVGTSAPPPTGSGHSDYRQTEARMTNGRPSPLSPSAARSPRLTSPASSVSHPSDDYSLAPEPGLEPGRPYAHGILRPFASPTRRTASRGRSRSEEASWRSLSGSVRRASTRHLRGRRNQVGSSTLAGSACGTLIAPGARHARQRGTPLASSTTTGGGLPIYRFASIDLVAGACYEPLQIDLRPLDQFLAGLRKVA